MTIVVSRLAVALFWWMTAIYAFLASSSFAYHQFLRPRVLEWVGRFSDWHGWLSWVALALTVVALAQELGPSSRVRKAAAIFVAALFAIGIVLVARPILPSLTDNRFSLVAGLAALVPIVWLAAIDHAAAWQTVRARAAAADTAATEGRLLSAALISALFSVVIYGALTPAWIGSAFEPDLLTIGLSIGLVWNAIAHLVIFGAAFAAMALVERTLAASAFLPRYLAAFGVVTIAGAAAAHALINNAIGLDGRWGALTAIAFGISVTSAWAGLRVQAESEGGASLVSGFDLFFGAAPARPELHRLVWLVPVALAAWAVQRVAARADWDFVLQTLGVVGVWVAAFAINYRARAAMGGIRAASIVVACAIPLTVHAADPWLQTRVSQLGRSTALDVRHTLDRYAVYNPAFRVADTMLRRRAANAPSFYRLLRANSGLGSTRIDPIDVKLVPALTPAPAPPPSIFLFVVDSLRPDYLSPYNARVAFTPRIAAFAAESVVFRNAFTRYGGTGLSVPALWSGGALPHKQYVQPFAPMNALEKLLAVNRYRRLVSLDSVMGPLLTHDESLVDLDDGVPTMQLDFCATVQKLQHAIARRPDETGPVFFYALPQNLHTSVVLSTKVPAGEAYPGFVAPYAASVRRIDSCFGGFIEFLKQRRMYDRSVVVVTSDHGELLGEDGRWGHAYYLFPEVLQIPLIVHFPAGVPPDTIDAGLATFSTDITPMLYAALGYTPKARPRRGTEVVAASYGAVYGTLSVNGRRLFIVDANHEQEFAYERGQDGWRAIAVTEAARFAGRRAIREYLFEIAQRYHFEPPF